MAKKRRGGQPAEPFWFCRVRVSAHCVGQRDGPVCKQCLLCTDEPTQEKAKLEHNHDVMQHIKAKGGLTQDDQCSNLFCDQYGCWGIVRKERIADMKCSKFINTGMCEEPPEPEEIASESEGPQSASSEGPSAAQWEELASRTENALKMAQGAASQLGSISKELNRYSRLASSSSAAASIHSTTAAPKQVRRTLPPARPAPRSHRSRSPMRRMQRHLQD